MGPARPNSRFQTALWIDRWVGPALCALLSLFRRRRSPGLDVGSGPPRRVLVIKFWGLGSIVLASPLLRELRERHPEAQIDFVTLSENLPLFEHLPDVHRVLAVDLSRGIPRFLLDSLRLIRTVRRERYDLLLDLEFFTAYSAVFSFFARARYSCGFSSRGSWRGRLHDTRIPFNSYHHVALNFLALFEGHLENPIPHPDPETALLLPPLSIAPELQESLSQRLAEAEGWKQDRALVVVNPNTGELALERRWPVERISRFLQLLTERSDANVVVTGSPGEHAFVASLVERAGVGSRVFDLSGALSIGEFVALLQRADVVVSNDSGPLHLAAAAGSSTVSLFGPETPTLYAPLRSREGQRHRVHYRGLACSPCINVHNHKMLSCWFVEAACMHGISADDVLASTLELLGVAPPVVLPIRVLDSPSRSEP